ncbi:hypothetical protein SS1G_02602 [Sclerotinia sclerotiorum 1980 UF-70]|uniref:Heterokaryon incompatibility domain-containing protein n=1 Tax=Sclerotinia sclerotiorum (strain ATCC 18683 / 1980 / Ss-1) TaxID=665079 RepID=A7EBB6_SCLS1|nr:hypothetical protein SS1G_02602 [Sclerotinia sclerotiorum 1980 UF-70]EDN99744.1 hypothetical protein SS1G_02602 [Sclerotinia sclerotiorum 1980 UF-70]
MKQYSYDPLDPSVDGIRLLHLSPGLGAKQPHCFLKHVTFGERPKYNAISYTWGHEARQQPIVINDQYFHVTNNLYDALLCLQQQSTEEQVLWVDAICINQEDIAERNRQLTIMPYIYERAKLVIIWLRDDQHIVPPVWPEPRKIPPFEISGHTQQYEDQRLLFNYLMMICSNEYWNRLWIIQEIGKARKLLISFGQKLIDWNRFMKTIILSWPYPGRIVEEIVEEIMEDTAGWFKPRHRRTAFSDTVPWKLYHQLLKKYDGGHKLHNLMVNHRHALCKEPRDKGDILKFGKLVRDSLGGQGITTIKEVSQDAFLKMPQKENRDRYLKDNNPTVLKIPARLVGQIVHLGPSHAQIMTDLSKTADWRLSIQHNLPKKVQASVQEESDLFLESLEDLDEIDLKIVSKCDFDVSWHPEIMPQGLSDSDVISKKSDPENEPPLPDCLPHLSSDGPQSLSTSPVEGARLFLLDNSMKENSDDEDSLAEDSLAPESLDATGNMGLGPAVARVGDYVCEITGIKTAAIIRKSKNKLSFIGTAGLARQAEYARKRIKSTPYKTFSPFSLPKFEDWPLDNMVDLYFYVSLAYQLLD